MNLALKDIRHGLFRFVLTCFGLGLLMTVVLAMIGIYNGLVADALAIVKLPKADVWVVEATTKGPFAEASKIPAATRDAVRRMPGVIEAGAITFQTIETAHAGRNLRLYVIGFERGRPGGPSTIVAGRNISASHFELVADRRSGLNLGDAVRLGRNRFTIVGLVEDAMNSGGDPAAFVTLADALDLQTTLSPAAARVQAARGSEPAYKPTASSPFRPRAGALPPEVRQPNPCARLSPVKAPRGCRVDRKGEKSMFHDPELTLGRGTNAQVSPSAHLLEELQLHGYRPLEEDGDARPLPSPEAAEQALTAIFEAATGLFAETRLEADLSDLLWGVTNLFHRQTERMGRLLDDNEVAQRNSQAQQDGSEVKSVELERLTAQGMSLIERRNAFEYFRDTAATLFAIETGSSWRPRSGSLVNHRALTSAMIDSRDFINARKVSETTVLVPAGHRIGFAGGTDYNDHARIWDILDKTLAKHTNMVLLHGGGARGAERIAACWAENRKVPQVVFKPDWAKHRNAAPFKRNDQLLEALPIGLILFPGSGIVENLGDKARKAGIPIWKCGQGA